MPGLAKCTAFRAQQCTFRRPAGGAEEGGARPPAAPTVLSGAAISCRVRDMTASVRRNPDGANVEVAVRLYTEHVATEIRPKDTVELVHHGDNMRLEVTTVRHYRRTQQIDAERKVGRASAGGR